MSFYFALYFLFTQLPFFFHTIQYIFALGVYFQKICIFSFSLTWTPELNHLQWRWYLENIAYSNHFGSLSWIALSVRFCIFLHAFLPFTQYIILPVQLVLWANFPTKSLIKTSCLSIRFGVLWRNVLPRAFHNRFLNSLDTNCVPLSDTNLSSIPNLANNLCRRCINVDRVDFWLSQISGHFEKLTTAAKQ